MREGIRVLERLELENSFQLRLNPLVSANMSLSRFSKVKCSTHFCYKRLKITKCTSTFIFFHIDPSIVSILTFYSKPVILMG